MVILEGAYYIYHQVMPVGPVTEWQQTQDVLV